MKFAFPPHVLWGVAAIGLITSIGWADEKAAENLVLFEAKIRPVLVEHCYDCHSGEEPESGLSVDSLAGLLRGGIRGPAIAPGRAEESLLVRVLRHGEQVKMPPKSKLSQAQIDAIARWVAMGAPWPGQEVAPLPSSRFDATAAFSPEQQAFWAFQVPQPPPLPSVRQSDWVQSPIDAFILAKLEAAGLTPAPPADRRMLLRRATFDLIGLPPTPAELADFLEDQSPDAFARVVDRLLASPQYGERWGRHWLDVARYSDSNGLDENLAYANAFRYRDYVVDAFNRDMPFDQFVREQIAGDLLPEQADSQENLARYIATGFLCLGAKMLAEDDPVKLQMDIIDEQVDTVGRAFLGLTLGCARCHDHKYDPISAEDYYGLAGIFKSTKTMDTFTVVARWQERPLATPEAIAAREAQQKQIDEVREQIKDLRSQATAAIVEAARQHTGDYLLAASERLREQSFLKTLKPVGDQPTCVDASEAILWEAENFARGNVLRDVSNYGQGIGVLVNQGQAPNFVEYEIEIPRAGKYQLEVRYAAASSRPCLLFINGELAKSDLAGGVTGSWLPDSQQWQIEGFFSLCEGTNVLRLQHPQFFPHIDKLLLAPAPQAIQSEIAPLDATYKLIPTFVQQWAKYLEKEQPAHEVVKQWRDLAVQGSPEERRTLAMTIQQYLAGDASDSRAQSWRDIVAAPAGPFAITDAIEQSFPAKAKAALEQARRRETQLQSQLPEFPHAMAVSDSTGEDLAIHYRGSHLTLGSIVPRRFPRILAGDSPAAIGPDRSGRLELANWITRPDHPLTARVFINRVWHWRFGKGLVRSPDNFGQLGERPTHPELLDWLATSFVKSGWSIKALHRTMLLSSTWQQSSSWDVRNAAADPENRLWWRYERRRLEVEPMRDAVLAVSGNIDFTMRGSLLPTPNRQYVTSTANVDPVVYVTNRRTIYLPVVRSALNEMFQVFDFAEPSVLNGERQTTTIAPQALFALNSKFIAEQTRTLAERLLAEKDVDDAGRVKKLWLAAYSRHPRQDEIAASIAFLNEYQTQWQASHPNAGSEGQLKAWQSLCRAVLGANEFVYLD